MRKLTRLLLAILVALVGNISVFAHDFEAENEGNTIYYLITSEEDLTCAVSYQGDNSSSVADEYSGSVVIPSSVEYNGKTYSVTTIGGSAFRNCTSLTSVVIPNSVTEIGSYAFSNCSSLASIEIPNSVTEIGVSAFKDCSNLMEITSLNTTPPSLVSSTFNNVDKETCVLKVPTESVEAYKAADYWKEFLNIEGLSEEAGINSIANGAASGKTYGINGAIVGDGYKGIVIRNGKKILVK